MYYDTRQMYYNNNETGMTLIKTVSVASPPWVFSETNPSATLNAG